MSYLDKYKEGKKAFKEGETILDNPYQNKVAGVDETTRVQNFEWWNIGWNDGHCSDLVKDVKTQGAI